MMIDDNRRFGEYFYKRETVFRRERRVFPTRKLMSVHGEVSPKTVMMRHIGRSSSIFR